MQRDVWVVIVVMLVGIVLATNRVHDTHRRLPELQGNVIVYDSEGLDPNDIGMSGLSGVSGSSGQAQTGSGVMPIVTVAKDMKGKLQDIVSFCVKFPYCKKTPTLPPLSLKPSPWDQAEAEAEAEEENQ